MTTITDDLPARLLHEERAAWEEILAGRGGEYFQRSMTRDALVVVPGAVLDRETVAASFDAGAGWDGYELHEPAVIRLGEHAGIVVYRAHARRGGQTAELHISTTYRFVDGGWCVALHQQTPA